MLFRSAMLAGALLAASASTPAAAVQYYPWCAQYGSFFHEGGRNCGFTSYAQCMATVSGIGGFCERNSFYKGPTKSKHRRRAAR